MRNLEFDFILLSSNEICSALEAELANMYMQKDRCSFVNTGIVGIMYPQIMEESELSLA